MYRIVATDMDETFLGSDHRVPQANVEAILAMRERGVLFVPASGRAYGSIMGSLRDLPAACLDDSYVISYNGGCINRVGESEPIISSRILLILKTRCGLCPVCASGSLPQTC